MQYNEITFLKVFDDRVIVERILDDEKIGSFWVPESAKIAHTIGYVVALGTGFSDDRPCPVQVGDRVLFSRYAGVSFNVGDRRDFRELIILMLGDIHGVFTAEDTTLLRETQPNWKY